MSLHNRLPDEKKVTVLFRIEPGSLGPDGLQYVEAFCRFAQSKLSAGSEFYLNWSIVPRYDKTLAEIKYLLGNKTLNQHQISQYLSVFGTDYAQFEDQLENNLDVMINQFLNR